MNFLSLLWVCICLLHLTSAVDYFQNFLSLGRKACFKVKATPSSCNATLADSYELRNPSPGVDKPDTKMYLFTPTNPDEAEPLHECGGRLPPGSTYDTDADTEIFIHGWLDGLCRSAWMREMKEQLMKRGRYNVILVDWSWGNSIDYYLASQNLKPVGEQVAIVINNIMRQTGVGAEKFHVVGHSYGAVAAGFTGRGVEGQLRRITGLDPGIAPFSDGPPNQRLTRTDARIVDIIHTNGGRCLGPVVGDARQLGDADFYPNGGTVQLNCYATILVYLLKGDYVFALGSLAIPMFCAHLQSIQYYKASINPNGCPFIGVEGQSYGDFLSESFNPSGNRTTAIMGMDYEQTHRDGGEQLKFYLKTGITCPYVDYSYLSLEERPSECKTR